MKPIDKKNKLKTIIIISTILLIISLIFQLSVGSYAMSMCDIINGIFNYNLLYNSSYLVHQIFGETMCSWIGISPLNTSLLSTQSLIIWNIRIPRFIVGACVGINLACSGCIFQAITKNEMASPYLLGISQGSGLSILIILMVFPALYNFIPLLAMIGGIFAFLLIYLIAWNHGTSPIRLILAGIIIGTIATALQGALFYFANDLLLIQNAMTWTTRITYRIIMVTS
jgi:iron complex transport system permease protein